MSTHPTAGYGLLTEKEKQTLRLIVRGHDAKSIARHLDLSVHTINERLRDARRKLAVSSSREAARRLLDREEATANSFGDERIGEAVGPADVEEAIGPENGGRRTPRPAWIITGAALMSIALAILVLTTLPQRASAPADSAPAATARATATDAEIEASARQWLAFVDQGRWNESWRGTTTSFRKLNTSKVWADVSEQVRVPLGTVLSRTLVSHDSDVPAPPHGIDVLKFKTSFANKPDTVETISLAREDGVWRVVGYLIG